MPSDTSSHRCDKSHSSYYSASNLPVVPVRLSDFSLDEMSGTLPSQWQSHCESVRPVESSRDSSEVDPHPRASHDSPAPTTASTDKLPDYVVNRNANLVPHSQDEATDRGDSDQVAPHDLNSASTPSGDSTKGSLRVEGGSRRPRYVSGTITQSVSEWQCQRGYALRNLYQNVDRSCPAYGPTREDLRDLLYQAEIALDRSPPAVIPNRLSTPISVRQTLGSVKIAYTEAKNWLESSFQQRERASNRRDWIAKWNISRRDNQAISQRDQLLTHLRGLGCDVKVDDVKLQNKKLDEARAEADVDCRLAQEYCSSHQRLVSITENRLWEEVQRRLTDRKEK